MRGGPASVAGGRLARFPADVWNQVNDLPDPPRTTVQRTIFGLFDRPVPAAACHLAADPAWYELHVSADDVTIWYTITGQQGHEVVSVLLTGGQGVEDDIGEDDWSSGLLDTSGCCSSNPLASVANAEGTTSGVLQSGVPTGLLMGVA